LAPQPLPGDLGSVAIPAAVEHVAIPWQQRSGGDELLGVLLAGERHPRGATMCGVPDSSHNRFA
jgi:hypothetical protein